MASARSAAIVSTPASKRKSSRTYGLRTFMDPGCPTDFAGTFADNIGRFVLHCADAEPAPGPFSTPTWCTQLVDEKSGVVVPLYTVEEPVQLSAHPFCDYCRCNGWSHHFVSKRRYHFIIPADNDWDKPLDSNAFHLATHLLHGLLHSNGFGHLLLINGHEGGSKFISGHLLMDLWDRFCTSLRVRAVTLEDTSQKYSMELRLLFGIAYGRPWFARWGYRFLSGSFGVDEKAYNRAINELSSLPLESLLDKTAIRNRDSLDLQHIVCHYSGPKCSTVSELFRHLLDLKHNSPQPSLPPKPKKVVAKKRKKQKDKDKKYKDFDAVAAALPSRWPVRRLKFAAQVIVDALIERDRMMTRQEVRDAARLTIGDTGLLDFVLKSLGDAIVGNHVVCRTTNPATHVLEFSLKKLGSIDDTDSVSESEGETGIRSPSKDLLTVYNDVSAKFPDAARDILDAKHWRKEFDLRDEFDDMLRFFIQWVPSVTQIEQLTRALPPAEIIVVDPHVSIGELKEHAERTMRNTYCMMERFRITDLEGLEGEDRDPVMFGGAESASVIWVRGEGADIECDLKYEGGDDTWAVGCECGARDDDGERMVSCDACDVWHHTRCIGIGEEEPVPQLFLCSGCGSSILAAAAAEELKEETGDAMMVY